MRRLYRLHAILPSPPTTVSASAWAASGHAGDCQAGLREARPAAGERDTDQGDRQWAGDCDD